MQPATQNKTNTSKENLELLFDQLKKPSFKEYHLFFLSDISDDIIRKIAECDIFFFVKNIRRVYFNYYAPNNEFAHSNQTNSGQLVSKKLSQWESNDLNQLQIIEETIISSMCSLRQIPVIRYLQNSDISLQIGDRVSSKLKNIGISYPTDFERGKSLLLIMERREDPITPLLFHWSYQSMLHEIFGINANKITHDGKEYNLNLSHDAFYENNLYSNYGDLINALRSKLESVSEKRQQNKDIQSFEDMQRILANMPEFKKDTSITSKHLSLADGLTKVINKRKLMELSKIEQDVASKESKKDQFTTIDEILTRKDVDMFDKFRLTCLFCLKYESSDLSYELEKHFRELKPSMEYIDKLEKLIQKCGRSSRSQKQIGGYLTDKVFQIYNDMFNVI